MPGALAVRIITAISRERTAFFIPNPSILGAAPRLEPHRGLPSASTQRNSASKAFCLVKPTGSKRFQSIGTCLTKRLPASNRLWIDAAGLQLPTPTATPHRKAWLWLFQIADEEPGLQDLRHVHDRPSDEHPLHVIVDDVNILWLVDGVEP